ncbi:Gmad2 immunoglobulin-like domain-containing protein [Nocardioides pyridinolyticus]
MNTPFPDLGDLLHDAVDELEPNDRLAAIREQVASAPAHAARPWWYAAGGVVLATAAAVTAFAVIGDGDDGADHDHVATSPGTFLVPAYFLGDSPRGERLFREFDEAPGDDALQAALDRIERPATDPDYRTPWTTSSFGDVMLMDGVIHVEVGDPENAVLDDELAVQQVVYTLQGAAQERLPVRIGDTTYEAQPQNDVLNLVSISDPAEGAAYEDGVFTARGRANVHEGTVGWEVRDASGQTVREGFTTALGTGDRLYLWEAEVDVSGLASGSYEFVASSTDPSGGAEQALLDYDTRTIIVR